MPRLSMCYLIRSSQHLRRAYNQCKTLQACKYNTTLSQTAATGHVVIQRSVNYNLSGNTKLTVSSTLATLRPFGRHVRRACRTGRQGERTFL